MADEVPCADPQPHGPHGWMVLTEPAFCPGRADMPAEFDARLNLALGGFTFEDITPTHWRD